MFNPKQDEAAVFKRFLTPKEQHQLLNTIKQYSSDIARRDYAVCGLLNSSGMRIGECLAVSVGDAVAALQDNRLFIPKEHRKGEVCDLAVPVTRPVRAALKLLLSLRDGAEMDEALIVSRNSASRGWKAMTVRAFELRVSYWVEQAGLPKGISPHWFRHTHAKNIVRSSDAKDPLRIVQITLGQKSRRSTEIYTRVDREELEEALSRVDVALNGKPRLRISHLRKQFEGRAGA